MSWPRRALSPSTWVCGGQAQTPIRASMATPSPRTCCLSEGTRWACGARAREYCCCGRKLNFITVRPYLMSVSRAAGDVLMKLEL